MTSRKNGDKSEFESDIASELQCLERMVCQYMSSEDGVGEDPIAGTFVDSILNFLPGGGGKFQICSTFK